jgi:hypothetical protein
LDGKPGWICYSGIKKQNRFSPIFKRRHEMKHQTVLPNRIPSSKLHSQEGTKNLRNLFSQFLVVILVVTLAFATYLTVRNLPLGTILNRPAVRLYSPVYDATGAMNAAIVLPGQVAKPVSWAEPYDATAAMLAAITPKKVASAYSRPYDATAAMNAAILLPNEVDRPVLWVRPYDATGTMLDAIVWP